MVKEILKLIENNNSIVICGHASPDGDCYGSQVALKQSLHLKYPQKDIRILGTGIPSLFSLLSPMDLSDEDFIKKSLAIIVDVSDLTRIENSEARNAKCFLKIDHHVDEHTFVEGPFIVDESANSTCDIIAKLIFENNLPIDEKVANALALGIITDSGRFQFVTRYKETFETMAKLVSYGADIRAINKIINITKEKDLTAKAYMLSNYKKTKNNVIYICYDKYILRKLGLTADSVARFINVFANIENCPVWISFAERENGEARVEVRSNGPKVQPIMVKYGGGGHMFAAGATLPSFSKDIINNVLFDLDEAIANGD